MLHRTKWSPSRDLEKLRFKVLSKIAFFNYGQTP